jgi:hypothetical protein
MLRTLPSRLLWPLHALQLASLVASWLLWARAQDGDASRAEAAQARALYGVALAAAQAATSAALVARLAALAATRAAPALSGFASDALCAWRLDAALRAQCGCGALLAPLWRAGRAAVRAGLARWLSGGGGAGGSDEAAAALADGAWRLYARVCSTTCAAAARRAAAA